MAHTCQSQDAGLLLPLLQELADDRHWRLSADIVALVEDHQGELRHPQVFPLESLSENLRSRHQDVHPIHLPRPARTGSDGLARVGFDHGIATPSDVGSLLIDEKLGRSDEGHHSSFR